MNLTPAILQAIFYGLDTKYQSAYKSVEPRLTAIATETPSNGRSQRHAWLAKIPRLKTWVGERTVINLSARGFEIVNQDYELTVGVGRNDIEDDNLGVYSPVVEMMAQQAKLWPDDLLTLLLQNGDSTTLGLCFDGQSFFSAAHPVDMDDSSKGTYSNLFSPGTSGSLPLNYTNVAYVRQQMRQIKGEDSKPLQVVPDTLIVPPALETQALQIQKATYIAPSAAIGANASGVMQENVIGAYIKNVIVAEQLAGADTTWYFADCSRPIKPFIFQLRKSPTMVMRTDPTLENVFNKKEFLMGVDSRGAAGFGLPFLASKCIG